VSERRPLVVKIGGGLLRAEGLGGLRRACAETTDIAASRPVLVLPGGGPFADAVRALDVQVGLSDEVAHALALRAMDQLGLVLASLMPRAELLACLVAPRALAMVEAAAAFGDRPDVPASWAVTSDSLAVLAADAIGAEEVILLKPVGGVSSRWPSDDPPPQVMTAGDPPPQVMTAGDPPLPVITASELQALQARGGGRAVDAYLPEAVRRTGVTVVVRRPGPARPAGTRITPG
jgi:aspartokinase-like uncharacterized kinase